MKLKDFIINLKRKKMKQYIGTKIIFAKPMTRGAYNKYRGWDTPENEKGMEKDKGYLVEYTNGGKPNHKDHKGYISWSPAQVFEDTYNPHEPIKEEHYFNVPTTFGTALQALRKGKKVYRYGWNGKGMFVTLQPASVKKGVSYREHFLLKTAQGDVAMWSPSGSDALADDWLILK